jgi:hypothetical protein
MLYQLPNGKVIYLTIDQFLDLTDNDIQYMVALNYGDHVVNPFTDSAIFKSLKLEDDNDEDQDDDNIIDDSIDISELDI